MWKKMSAKGKIALWILTIVIIFLILLLLIYAIFGGFTASSRRSDIIRFTYGTGSRHDPSVEGSEKEYRPNGVAYANFSLLCAACGFSQSGDADEVRYIIEVDEGVYDTVTFFRDSRKVIVNGVHVTLSRPVRETESGVMVPCEFIARYMTGITVDAGEDFVKVVYEEGKIALLPSLKPIDPIEP